MTKVSYSVQYLENDGSNLQMYFCQNATTVEEEGTQAMSANNESSESEGPDFDDDEEVDETSSRKKVYLLNLKMHLEN